MARRAIDHLDVGSYSPVYNALLIPPQGDARKVAAAANSDGTGAPSGGTGDGAEPTMFYACVAIVLMVVVMFACLAVSIVDLERYNFGLYIVLLCIIGIMLACALCIANPTMCANPRWYVHLCAILNDMGGERERAAAAEAERFTGNNISSILRNAKQAAADQADDDQSATQSTHRKGASRATGAPALVMLAPAMHIMNGIWKGMAWVAEDMDDEEESDMDEEDEEESTSEVLTPRCHKSKQMQNSSPQLRQFFAGAPDVANHSGQQQPAPHRRSLVRPKTPSVASAKRGSLDERDQLLMQQQQQQQHGQSVSAGGAHFAMVGSELRSFDSASVKSRERCHTSASEGGAKRLQRYRPSNSTRSSGRAGQQPAIVVQKPSAERRCDDDGDPASTFSGRSSLRQETTVGDNAPPPVAADCVDVCDDGDREDGATAARRHRRHDGDHKYFPLVTISYVETV